MSKKPYKNKLSAMSNNNKEDVAKEELPVEIIEAAIFPEESAVQVITDTAPAPQVEMEPEVIEEISEPALVPLYQVHIDHPSKRYRKEPSLDSETVGLITDQGIYDVYEEKGLWIKLGNGYWTMRENTSKIKK